MNKSEKKAHIICKYFLCDSVIDVIDVQTTIGRLWGLINYRQYRFWVWGSSKPGGMEWSC